MAHSLTLTLRMAWREMRGGLRDFTMFMACLGLGVAAVAAVGTLSTSVDSSLRDNARTLLGGDLALRQIHQPLSQGVLDALTSRGRVARFTTLRSMARSNDPLEPRSTLIEIKAVDQAYPLLGQVELASGRDLAQALAPSGDIPSAVVDPALPARLGIEVGDVMRLGQAEFVISDLLAREPDTTSSFFGLGMRIMIRQSDLEATDLVRTGSIVTYHATLLLDPGLDPFAVKAELEAAFPDAPWRLRDYTQASRTLEQILSNMTLYLTLVGVAALLVGGIGAANGVRSFIAAREASIATFKCLGATRAMVVAAYLAQVLALSLVACAFGVVLGLVSAWFAGLFLAGVLPVDLGFTLHAQPLLAATGLGLLTTLIFSLWPLSAAGAVSPAQLFRGHADPVARRPGKRMLLAVLLLCLALYGLLAWYVNDAFLATAFSGAILVCTVFFLLLAKAMRFLAAHMPRPRDPRLRHALTGLYRPGAPTTSVIFSIGLGLTVLAAVTLTDGNMQHLISNRLPEVAPAFFYIDIPPAEIDAFLETARSVPGVTLVESQPSLRGRIVRINGRPVDQVQVDPDSEWALRSERGLTFAAEPDQDMAITAGEWWPPDTDRTGQTPLICFDAALAKGFGIGVGDTLTVNVLGRDITAEIACLREIDWTSLSINHTFIFAPGTLENAPHAFIATVRTDNRDPATTQTLDRLVSQRFPDVVVIDMSDILSDVRDIFSQIGITVRATAVLTLLAGLLVLAETLRANLRRRRYEAVVFKVLGATRRDIMVSLVFEFLLLGGAAALMAGALGLAVSYPFVTWVLKQQWVFLPVPLALIITGGMAATLVLGLMGVRAALGRKAWPVLRNE